MREAISQRDQALEYLLMGLRVRDGIDQSRYEALAGEPLNGDTINHLCQFGMITTEDQKISVSEQGVMVLNSVIAELSAS